MTYLRAKKKYFSDQKNKKILVIALIVCVLLFVFIIPPANHAVSSFFQGIARYFWQAGNITSSFLEQKSFAFISEESLVEENRDLKSQIAQFQAGLLDRQVLFEENIRLKDAFERKKVFNMSLGVILSKPPISPYDTIFIDIGSDDGVMIDQKVFAYGNIFIGKISEVYLKTSKVKLLSFNGEKTSVVLGEMENYFDLIGTGVQNFEIMVPKEILINMGDSAVYPDIAPYVVAIVSKIITDDRNPFNKILLTNPVNIQELKFVEV